MPSKHTTRGGIYAIRHVAHDKLYIGSAVNIFKRWSGHRMDLARGEHHSRHLQRAWDRDGASAFVFEVLQVVEDRADLVRIEQEYLDHFQSYRRPLGYNLRRDASSNFGLRWSPEARAGHPRSNKGRKLSPEHRARMSAAKKGIPRKPFSEEHRARLKAAAGARRPRDPFSEEHRAKLSAAAQRRAGSAEGQAQMSAARKARMMSAEARAEISAAHKGKTVSPETRAKISAAMKGRQNCLGRVLSAETRAKISAANQGQTRSAETRAKMSAARRPGHRRASVGQRMFEFSD